MPKKNEDKTDDKGTDERLYGDDIGANVETNAGPDASDGGVANAPGLEE